MRRAAYVAVALSVALTGCYLAALYVAALLTAPLTVTP